jgi:hypothetical protein
MSGRRGLTVLAGIAAAAAWLMAGSSWQVDTPVRAARPQPPAPAVLALEPVPVVHIDRLAAATRPRPGSTRDPFRFVETRRPGGSAAVDTPDERHGSEATPPADVEPLRPEFHLIGLAEDDVNGRMERTAVISAPNQVYLVREGDQIGLRFLVDRIGADAVHLRDLANDGAIVLPLR